MSLGNVMNSESEIHLWQAKIGAGRMAYQSGLYPQAARHFRAAMEMVKEKDLPADLLSISMLNLAKTLGSIGEFAEAEELLKKTLSFDESEFAVDSTMAVELIEDFHQLSLLYWRASRVENARQALQRALELLSKSKDIPDELIAKLLKHQAVLAELSGDLQQCEKMVNKAIAFIAESKVLGKYSTIYGDCLFVKVVLLTEQNRFDEALENYREGMHVMELTHGEMHPKIVEHLEVLGKLAAKKGFADTADHLLKKAEHMRLQLRKKDAF